MSNNKPAKAARVRRRNRPIVQVCLSPQNYKYCVGAAEKVGGRALSLTIDRLVGEAIEQRRYAPIEHALAEYAARRLRREQHASNPAAGGR